ncbi:MAG TPA: hypothetical protein VFS09_06525 [Candidatus Eisenbacteria bacterium]|nr:hypothetical protein [Candidatus Eisenbacteria bacterium]
MSDKAKVFAYHRGWTHGAGAKSYEAPERLTEDYERGYRDGRAASRAAAQAEAERLGVTLAVVSVQAEGS